MTAMDTTDFMWFPNSSEKEILSNHIYQHLPHVGEKLKKGENNDEKCQNYTTKTEVSLPWKLHISLHHIYHHFKGRNWKIKCHLEIIISSFETHLVYKSNPAAVLPSSQPQRFHTSLFMGSHLCRFIYQQHFISIRR